MGDAGPRCSARRTRSRNAGRSGALDELLASGALTDLTSTNDDIQAQLDKAKGTSDIDAQIAALKTQVASGATTSLLRAMQRPLRRPTPRPARRDQVMADSKIETTTD